MRAWRGWVCGDAAHGWGVGAASAPGAVGRGCGCGSGAGAAAGPEVLVEHSCAQKGPELHAARVGQQRGVGGLPMAAS